MRNGRTGGRRTGAWAKRLLWYLAGIWILGLGMVLNTRTGLGTAAIVSLPYAISEMSSLSLGTATTLLYFLYIFCQWVITRRLTAKMLLQIPFSYGMGLVVDCYNMLLTISAFNLFSSFFLLFWAILLTAIGAYLILSMDLVLNPVDGLVKTISKAVKKEFGRTKLVFDCSVVLLTTVISVIGSGKIIGIGLGTVLSAVSIGNVISLLGRYGNPYFLRIVAASQKKREQNLEEK